MQDAAKLNPESIDRLGKPGVFIVGLAGPSGSGKSTVAKRVASRLKGQVLSMESYAIEMNHLPPEERARLDYDAPHATDVRLLESHIRAYAAGKTIEAPVYDFAQHSRLKRPARTHSCHVFVNRGRHLGFAFRGTAPARRSIHLFRGSRRDLFFIAER